MTCELYLIQAVTQRTRWGDLAGEGVSRSTHIRFCRYGSLRPPLAPMIISKRTCQADKPETCPTLRESVLPFHFQAAL